MTKPTEWREEFLERGYAIIPKLLPSELIARALQGANQIYANWREDPDATPPDGTRFLERTDKEGTKLLDATQGAHRLDSALAEIRTHPSVRRQLNEHLGPELVTVVDTVMFKSAREWRTGIAFHRDADFRTPPENYRDLANSSVQVGIALERHGPENGGLLVAPGSHRRTDIDCAQGGSVRGKDDLMAKLPPNSRLSFDAIKLDPGDAVLWSSHLIHGSPANRSRTRNRRFYVIGYMSRAACDCGVPVPALA